MEELSELVNPINVTNQTFIMKQWPVTPGWRASVAWCTCTRVDHNLCQFNLSVQMHWHTCKSLLNTLERAVEQLAVCIAKQAVEAKVQQSCKAGAKR